MKVILQWSLNTARKAEARKIRNLIVRVFKIISKQQLDGRCAINALRGDVGLGVLNGRNAFSVHPCYLLSSDNGFRAAHGRGEVPVLQHRVLNSS